MSIINLPLLPLLKASGHLSDFDMINLSFCSRRTAQLVKVSHRFPSTSSILCNSNGESHEIIVKILNSTFTIYVEPSSKGQIVPNKYSVKMDMQGTVSFRGFVMHSFKHVGWDREQFSTILYDTREDFVVLFKALTEHLLNLHATPPQLNLKLEPSDIPTYPFLKNWKKWDRVIVVQDYDFLQHYGCSQYYRFSRNCMSSEVMRFLLNESEYIECLDLYGEVEDGFQYSEGFKQNKIHFSHSPWVQMDSVINSTSRDIILRVFPKPMCSQLINLLELWIAKKKMVNLTSLELDLNPYYLTGPARYEKFRRDIWREIGLSRLDDAITGEILRIDGVRARVDLGESKFRFHVL